MAELPAESLSMLSFAKVRRLCLLLLSGWLLRPRRTLQYFHYQIHSYCQLDKAAGSMTRVTAAGSMTRVTAAASFGSHVFDSFHVHKVCISSVNPHTMLTPWNHRKYAGILAASLTAGCYQKVVSSALPRSLCPCPLENIRN